MTWLLLAVAIVVEVAATSTLKLAGQGKPWAIAAVVAGYALSFLIVAREAVRSGATAPPRPRTPAP